MADAEQQPDPGGIGLRGRLAIVAVGFLAVVLVSAGVSTIMVGSWSQSLVERGELRDVSDEVAALRLAYSDQETGIRGYLLSQDESFLQPFRAGEASAARNLAALRARDIGDARFDAQLDAVERAATTWLQLVADPALTSSGAARGDEGGAQSTFDALRAELDRLDEIVAQRVQVLVDRAEERQHATVAVLIASGVAAVGGTLLVTLLFRRWVTRPLAQISDAARLLSQGDEAQMPDFDAPELQSVSDAITSLQTSLAGARDNAVRAYTGLEQSAVLAIQVRTELANELGTLPDGWSVDSLLLPAEGVVAGDCYDLGLLDRHRFYVIAIDVTGHGASSALDALKAKTQLRAALRSRLAPGVAISWLARENQVDERADLLTAIVAVVDTETGECQYANAGHPPMIVTDGVEHQTYEPTGPLVGAFSATWTTERCTIPVGATLVVHTDGVTDVIGTDRERFGEERLLEALGAAAGAAGSRPVVEAVRAAVGAFAVGPRVDDLSLVVVQRGAPPDAPQPGGSTGIDTVLP